jgi:hypothetical protein
MGGLPVPAECVGITLYKNFGDDNYRGTERVVFKDRNGLETTLRRAAISGKIEIGSNIELGDFFADLHDAEGSIVTHVNLDAKSFKALKEHWLGRPRYVT